MSQTSNSTLATLGVKYRLTIIIWAKKFVIKHNLLRKVLNKTKQMEEVRKFKEDFKPLFENGLPIFSNHNGKLLSKEEYNALLTQARMDHSKFEGLEKKLKGESIVNKLSNDFDILAQFKMIKSNSPFLSISPCVELQILVR